MTRIPNQANRSWSAATKAVLLGVCTLMLLAGGAGHAEEDYRVGPWDLLKINAFGYPDLTTEARVTQSRHITFPMLGEVEVAGLSTSATETLLAKRLADLIQPNDVVRVRQSLF